MDARSSKRRTPAVLKPSDYAMTHAEIAAHLGITSGGVHMAEKSALQKARAILVAKGISAEHAIAVLRML